MSLELRPDCERCGRDLPPDDTDARICSFECTFCVDCVRAMHDVCPNCGGAFQQRPARVGDMLARHPAGTERRFRA